MKNKILFMKSELASQFILYKRIICFLLLLTLGMTIPNMEAAAKSSSYSAAELQKVIDGVLNFKQKQANVSTVQKLIDGELTDSAGKSNASDWFVIALCRYKGDYDYSSYQKALDAYVSGENNARATDLQRMALAYSAIGSGSVFIKDTIDSSVGKLGVMSYIYGLVLLDSGDYSSSVSREKIIDKILSLRLSDGGWALSGAVSDIDITAMALQALAPYREKKNVSSAIDKALTLLSKRQLDTGDYKSWGNRCCESTAQVITALSVLQIDYQTDKRFVKKSHTLIDGLMEYRLSDGSFCHLIGGNSNDTASVQAMYSLIAAWRQEKGLSPFYSFKGSAKSETAAAGSNTANVQKEIKASDKAEAGGSPNQTEAISGDNTSGQTNTSSINNSGSDASTKNTLTGEKPTDSVKNQKIGSATENNTQATDNNIASQNITKAAGNALSDQPNKANTAGGNKNAVQAEETNTDMQRNKSPHMDYRMIISIVIFAAAFIYTGFLFAKKRLNRKSILRMAVLAGIVLTAVWGIRLQSAKNYYQSNAGDTGAGSDSVTISILCNTVVGKKSEHDIPDDGIILNKAQIPIKKGDTVLDILIQAAKQNKIPLDYEGGEDNSLSSAYVKGINDLYENDFGDQSGWLYRINGEFPGTACGDYKVSDQDIIEWVYTCNLGKDVGRK